MKLVLLSGGSGKRLWPLSNDSRSKQFLKVLQGPNNELESMIQRVWRQLGSAGVAEDSYIATGKGQAEMIQSQIGMDAPLIIEPERRDTFPAIALAAVYLYSMEDVSTNEVITVMPVDPYVEDHFFCRNEAFGNRHSRIKRGACTHGGAADISFREIWIYRSARFRSNGRQALLWGKSFFGKAR